MNKWLEKEEIQLTPVEFTILKILASKQGRVFSRDQILEQLWGSPTAATGRTIDVHIRHLRSKLGKAGEFIQNVRTIGYKIEPKS